MTESAASTHNLKLTRELSEAHSIQSALFQITQVASDTDSLDDFYSEIHKIVGELMYAENFFIALYKKKQQLVQFVYFVDSVDNINLETLSSLPVDALWQTGTGYILKYGKMLHADTDRLNELQRQGHFEQLGSQCVDWLGVPLISKKEILGALVIQSYDEKIYYRKKDEDILQFVSQQIAIVLETKQFEQELQNVNTHLEEIVLARTAELEKTNAHLQLQVTERIKAEQLQKALYKITELTNANIKLNEFLAQIHLTVSELMYAENLFIALLNAQKDQINFPYYFDTSGQTGHSRSYNSELPYAGLTERVLSSGKSFLYSKASPAQIFPGRGHEPESWIGVPLKNQSSTFGVLAVQSYKLDHTFGEQDQHLLKYVGRHIATAIMRRKDASDIREAHIELKHINDELEQRVVDRTQEIAATNTILRQNIEERIQIEKKLAHDALHDSLTGLANRALFKDRLEHALQRIQRSRQQPFAVLFLDLDRFKLINDSLGHHIGDRLLQEISHRLLACVRPGDTVSRLGGDEFCILLDEIPDDEFAIKISQRILNALNKSICFDDQNITSSASIGVRLSHPNDKSPSQIMRDADAAMYQAKESGKARYCLFDQSMHDLVVNRLKLEQDLRSAVENDQLVLYYQPIVDLASGKIVGVEGLVRWIHPKEGIIQPNDFIPIAEETGMVIEIGARVLSIACKTLKDWSTQPQFKDLSISVNISPKQISQGDLISYIGQLLQNNQLDGSKLNLEITENVLVHNFETAKALILGLKSFGTKIYLDDFGTGYSSLSYLYNFPFDVLKLDRSFVNTINLRTESEVIVKSIKMLCNNLNLESVAEGIETESQLKKLMNIGYTYGQGYLFSKPVPQSDLETLITSFKFPSQL